MPTIEKKIREFWERSGVKDPVLKDVLRAGMVYLAEEIIDAVESQHKEMNSKYQNLVTKEDLKLVIELIDKRFEAQQKETNALRQEMQARFEAQQKIIDERFIAQQKETNALRQEMHARFEAQQKETNALRQEMNEKEKRLNFVKFFILCCLLLAACCSVCGIIFIEIYKLQIYLRYLNKAKKIYCGKI